MSHAIRIRCATPAAPADALERIESVRSTYRTTLEAEDMPYSTVPAYENRPSHDVGLYRFDDAEDLESILDQFSNDAFPSTKWLLIESHVDCVAEGDPRDRGHCDGWTVERTRGNVPEVFLPDDA